MPDLILEDRILLAAQGYIELGMPREALEELRSLPKLRASAPQSLEIRIVALIRLGRWKSAAASARKLCRQQPGEAAGFIHLAYCLHEMGETARAKETLLNAPEAVRRNATCYYNLACYEAVLGQLDSARYYLARSISMDERFREFARHDRDLAALRDESKKG